MRIIISLISCAMQMISNRENIEIAPTPHIGQSWIVKDLKDLIKYFGILSFTKFDFAKDIERARSLKVNINYVLN